MLFATVWNNLKKSPLLSAAILLMFSVGLFLSIGLLSYYGESDEKFDRLFSVYSDDSYRYYVQYVPDGPDSAGDMSIERITALSDCLQRLMRETAFDTYTFSERGLLCADYRGPDECLCGYANFTPYRDYTTAPDGGLCSQLSGYLVSPGIFAALGLEVCEGRDFSDYSQLYTAGDVIPAVFGWTLHDAYRVGDTFQGVAAWDRMQTVTYEVVGFLPPDTAILPYTKQSEAEVLSLSDAALYPTVDVSGLPIPDYTQQLTAAQSRAFYLQDLLTMLVFSDSKTIDFSAYLDQTAGGRLNSYSTMRVSPALRRETESYFELLTVVTVLVLGCSTVCLLLNMTNKLLSNFRIYAIHQIAGGTLGGVTAAMIIEAASIVFLADLLAFGLAAVFGEQVFSYGKSNLLHLSLTKIDAGTAAVVLALSAVICLVSLVFPLVRLHRVEFDTLLRGKEG